MEMDGRVLEFRFHGRGGQGAVTTAELLAQAAIAEGKYAQAFPSFGPERRGAPVVAYARISNSPIRVRSQVYEPDVVVVLDPSLVKLVDVTSGLKEEGIVIANLPHDDPGLRSSLEPSQRLVLLDATHIATDVLGRPITNTTMLGALVKVTRVVEMDSLVEPLKHRFGRIADRNLEAMRKAFESV